jgi:hypothetical protein
MGGVPGPQIPANQQIAQWLQQLDATLKQPQPDMSEISQIQTELLNAQRHMVPGDANNLLSQINGYIREYQYQHNSQNLQNLLSASENWIGRFGGGQ